MPPSPSTSFTSAGLLEGFREVAMTLWPALRAMCASEVPKPEEHPVMSQTRGLFGEGILIGFESDGYYLNSLRLMT